MLRQFKSKDKKERENELTIILQMFLLERGLTRVESDNYLI